MKCFYLPCRNTFRKIHCTWLWLYPTLWMLKEEFWRRPSEHRYSARGSWESFILLLYVYLVISCNVAFYAGWDGLWDLVHNIRQSANSCDHINTSDCIISVNILGIKVFSVKNEKYFLTSNEKKTADSQTHTSPSTGPTMLSFSLGKYRLTPGQHCDGETKTAGQPGERAEEKSAGKTRLKNITSF